MPHDRNEFDFYNRRFHSLKQEYETFKGQHRDLSEFFQPRKGRFQTQDRNKGDERWNKIINSHATNAAKIATAGMFNGTMNPAQPWFKFGLLDPDLMEFPSVKIWLERQEKLIRAIFLDGNLYTMAPVFLKELLIFATSCMTQVDDFEHVSRFYTHTIGSYFIAQNEHTTTTVDRRFCEQCDDRTLTCVRGHRELTPLTAKASFDCVPLIITKLAGGLIIRTIKEWRT